MQVFPATESTLSAVHIGHLLQQRYNLGVDTSCKLFRTGMNHLYQVSDGVDRFVFRIYTCNWRTRLDICEELRLLQHLKENEVPVSFAIADKEGDLLQEINAPEGIRYGVLFSFAAGEKRPNLTAETSYHIGRAVAKMHTATAGFELKRMTYNSVTLLEDSLRRTKAFFVKSSDDVLFLEHLTAFLVNVYERVATENVRYGALHLDIWFDNMHLDGTDGVTFFDFDFCGNGWLCHDVSYFLHQLFNTNQGTGEYEVKAARFLEGYESVVKLSDEEKRILPLTSLGVMLFYISVQCDRYDTWSNIFLNDDHLKRFVGSLKRWMAYNDILIA